MKMITARQLAEELLKNPDDIINAYPLTNIK